MDFSVSQAFMSPVSDWIFRSSSKGSTSRSKQYLKKNDDFLFADGFTALDSEGFRDRNQDALV